MSSIATARLLLLPLAALTLIASTPTASAEVAMRLDFVAWGDAVHGLTLGGEGRGSAVTAHAFTYSDPVAYRGPQLLEIHSTGAAAPVDDYVPTADDLSHQLIPLAPEETAGANGGGGPDNAYSEELRKLRVEKPTLVALARLPSGSRRATVLLAPLGGGIFQTYVINDDPTTLKPGELRVHNLSPYPVAMRGPGRPAAEIKTRGTITIPARDEMVIYELAYQRDDTEWVVQESNVIPVRENEQTQMMILRSDNSYFLSSDGASGGFLQTVFLRRLPAAP